MNCKFWVFRCSDDIDTCKKFKEGHDEVLKEYNVSAHSISDDSWMNNPHAFCIVAETLADNKIVGGLRLQIFNSEFKLPIENAVGLKSNTLVEDIQKLSKNGGIAEIEALWHSRRVAGNGISILLLRSAVSICNQLPINTLLSLCASYSLEIFQSIGFANFDKEMRQTKFDFPTEEHVATIMGITDLKNLTNSDAETKARVLSLRQFPTQTFLEEQEEIKVNYDLIIK